MIRIGVDIDGVLANFDHRFLELLNKIAGTDKKLEGGPKVWEWPTHQLGFSGEVVNTAWNKIHATGGLFWSTLPPLPGAWQAVRRMQRLVSERKAEVYFITGRPGHGVKAVTEAWLASLGMHVPTVIQVAGFSKGLVAAALDLDAFIEDCPAYLAGVLGSSPRTVPILVKRPYNLDLQDARVVSVDDINAALDAAFGKGVGDGSNGSRRLDGVGKGDSEGTGSVGDREPVTAAPPTES